MFAPGIKPRLTGFRFRRVFFAWHSLFVVASCRGATHRHWSFTACHLRSKMRQVSLGICGLLVRVEASSVLLYD